MKENAAHYIGQDFNAMSMVGSTWKTFAGKRMYNIP